MIINNFVRDTFLEKHKDLLFLSDADILHISAIYSIGLFLY